MSRETLARHLAQAEARVAVGQKHIGRQKEIIAELDAVGHDAETARALLVVLRQRKHCTSRTAIKSPAK
jgi:hypothetical protein